MALLLHLYQHLWTSPSQVGFIVFMMFSGSNLEFILNLLYDTVVAELETKRQKARDSYTKLTAEQKAQRNAKRREAYALKRNGSFALEMHTLVTNCGIVSTAKTFKHA